MDEARDIALRMLKAAPSRPTFRTLDDARAWVVDQWPDWRQWIGTQMLGNVSEAAFQEARANG